MPTLPGPVVVLPGNPAPTPFDGSPQSRLTPAYAGQMVWDYTNNGLYIACGTQSDDWWQIGGGYDNSHQQTPGIGARGANNVLISSGLGQSVSGVLSFDQQQLYAGNQTTDPAALVLLGQVSPFGSTTSGSLDFFTLTSGVATSIENGIDVETYTPVTFNPTGGADATCLVELSPDDSTYSVLGIETSPAGATPGEVRIVRVRVPQTWFLRLTVTNATLADTTYA